MLTASIAAAAVQVLDERDRGLATWSTPEVETSDASVAAVRPRPTDIGVKDKKTGLDGGEPHDKMLTEVVLAAWDAVATCKTWGGGGDLFVEVHTPSTTTCSSTLRCSSSSTSELLQTEKLPRCTRSSPFKSLGLPAWAVELAANAPKETCSDCSSWYSPSPCSTPASSPRCIGLSPDASRRWPSAAVAVDGAEKKAEAQPILRGKVCWADLMDEDSDTDGEEDAEDAEDEGAADVLDTVDDTEVKDIAESAAEVEVKVVVLSEDQEDREDEECGSWCSPSLSSLPNLEACAAPQWATTAASSMSETPDWNWDWDQQVGRKLCWADMVEEEEEEDQEGERRQKLAATEEAEVTAIAAGAEATSPESSWSWLCSPLGWPFASPWSTSVPMVPLSTSAADTQWEETEAWRLGLGLVCEGGGCAGAASLECPQPQQLSCTRVMGIPCWTACSTFWGPPPPSQSVFPITGSLEWSTAWVALDMLQPPSGWGPGWARR